MTREHRLIRAGHIQELPAILVSGRWQGWNETSPQTLRLRTPPACALAVEARNHMGYEIRDTDK